MISIYAALTLVVLHFVADFLLQNSWMALGKSKRWDCLLSHTLVYSSCFAGFGWRFALVTFALHTTTDYVTSRQTSKLWFFRPYGDSNMWRFVPEKRDAFWKMIGFDQCVHYVCLLLVYVWLS